MRLMILGLAALIMGGAFMVCPQSVRDEVGSVADASVQFVASFDEAFNEFLKDLEGPPGDLDPSHPL